DLVSRPPDRSQLKEIFRRFEFRALLGRVDTLDEALPAAERPQLEGQAVPWVEGALGRSAGGVAVAWGGGGAAMAGGEGPVLVASASLGELERALRKAEVVGHDAKSLRLGRPAGDDTLIAAYLIDPGRAEYLLDDLAAEYGLELEPDPPAEEETAALVRGAE